MRCPGCTYEILDADWKYCLRCGTLLAKLRPPGAEELTPKDVPCCVGSQTVSLALPLNNEGNQPLDVEVALAQAPSWLRLEPGRDSLVIPPGETRQVRLVANPPTADKGHHPVHLVVRSNDGRRDEDPASPWKRDVWRTQTVRASINVQLQSALVCQEELLVFSDRRPDLLQRELTLLNTGTVPVTIRECHVPFGFDVLTPAGGALVLLGDGGAECVVPPQQGGVPGRARLVARVIAGGMGGIREQFRHTPLQELVLLDSGGREYRVRLLLTGDAGARLAAPYIISIDFGTENTSVYARDPQDPRSVEPVPIFVPEDLQGALTEEDREEYARVPSYIAYRKDRPHDRPVVGREAKRMFGERFSSYAAWDVWRDVKVWLRSEEPELRQRYQQLLRHFLTRLREDINGYLGAKDPDGRVPDGVKYVAMLPVLDNGEKYREQEARMRDVLWQVYGSEISAGSLTPDDFVFVQEPQAAAACFLLGLPQGSDMASALPLGGYRRGDLIAIVDSGAGTTDLAVVQVTDGEDAGMFDVLATLGTTLDRNGGSAPTELVRFGGRMVDECVLEVMCRNAVAKTLGREPSPAEVDTAQRVLARRAANIDGLDEKTRELAGRETALVWCESAKIALESHPVVELADHAPVVLDDADLYSAERSQVEQRLMPALEQIVEGIQRILDDPDVQRRIETLPPEQRRIRYLFAVGGNANEPQLEERLRERFGHDVVVSLGGSGVLQRLRMLAVVRGGVWSYDAPIGNLAPCGLSYQLDDQPKRPLLHQNAAVLGGWQRRSQPIRIAGPESHAVSIYASLGQSDYRLGRVVLSGAGQHSLLFTLSDDWALAVRARHPDGTEEAALECTLK